jgi:hypothetical protein
MGSTQASFEARYARSSNPSCLAQLFSAEGLLIFIQKATPVRRLESALNRGSWFVFHVRLEVHAQCELLDALVAKNIGINTEVSTAPYALQ